MLLQASAALAEDRPTLIVLELTTKGTAVTPQTAEVVGSLLPTYVGQTGRFRVRSGSEIKEMMQFEATKENAGCDDNSCLAELAGALGARYVLFGNISKLGSLVLINLALYDNDTGEAVSRQTLQAKRLEDPPVALDEKVLLLLRGVGNSGAAPPPTESTETRPADPEMERANKTPQERFNDEVLVFNSAGNPFADSWLDFLFPEVAAYQGQSSRPISPGEFYEAVGHEEFANAYRNTNITRYALLLGGSAAFVVGGIGALTVLVAFPNGKGLFDTVPVLSTVAYYGLLIGSLVVLIGGGAAVTWGVSQNPHPVNANERKRLTDQHNNDLRRELGVKKASPFERARLAFADPLQSNAE